MNKLNTSLLAAMVACAFSAGAMAQGISKDEYKSGKDRATAQVWDELMQQSRGEKPRVYSC